MNPIVIAAREFMTVLLGEIMIVLLVLIIGLAVWRLAGWFTPEIRRFFGRPEE
jgi:hypothetical protein